MMNSYADDRMLDVQQLSSAAERYLAEDVPELSAADEIEPPRDDNRKRYLKSSLTDEKARAVVAEAEAHGAVSSAADTLAGLAQERIIGSNDIRDINYLELAVAVARGVCRIRLSTAYGSGVLVGSRLLMTNHHVLRTADDALDAVAQFDYQENAFGEPLPVHAYRFDPGLFFFTDVELDITVVAVAELSAKGRPIGHYPWIKLIPRLGKAERGDPVNIIQHPRGGLKQVALRNNQVIVIPDGKTNFLYYTTDTEPGSSGSPCFNDQWELIALHHSGVPRMDGGRILRKDGKPWVEQRDDPALIDWIANEGARVSAIHASLSGAVLEGAASELRDAAFGDTPPNLVELARRHQPTSPAFQDVIPTPAVPTGESTAGPGAVSFSVPLTITVSLGGVGSPAGIIAGTTVPMPRRDAAPPEPPGASTPAMEVDQDWSTRAGYDQDFLSIAVPLPKLSRAQQARSVEVPAEFRIGGDKHVLAYHHFSLAMNRERRFAWYSAANVDGLRRPVLPSRRDRWFIDPRIDDPRAPENQLGEELYAAKNTDRGHLTRYLDVAWGEVDEAARAASDSFHFTNACLQLDGFNQRPERWQGIEQFLYERKAKRDQRRISVFTGPIFRPDDPPYRNEHMDAAVRIPLGFWKVCALIREDGTLSATAFVLDQADITSLPGFEAFVDVAAVQTTLANVEKRTGLTFPVLRDHDHLAAGGAAGTLEVAGQTVIPVRTFDDIVV